MPKGNPNPVHRFSSTNQPTTRRKSKRPMQEALLKKLKAIDPATGVKERDLIVQMVLDELAEVRAGKKAMSAIHMDMIKLVLVQSDGVQKQEVDVDFHGAAPILVPVNVDQVLEERATRPALPAPTEDDDDE
jgi:hypothetical protein